MGTQAATSKRRDGRGDRGRPRVVLLAGPTATGKTDIAVEAARTLPCEILSVDSAMIYRGMDIGTAKPPPGVQAIAPHRLIDICDPAEAYSAARFRADALREIAAVHRAGRVPLLVGGTMLYFRALERGLSALPPADPQVRARLLAEAEEVGWGALHARLARIDPGAARRIHPNDPQRIQRALEVHALTGRPLSELQAAGAPSEPLPFDVVKIHVVPAERAVLHRRIETRFHAMLRDGLLEEVGRLRARGDLHPGMPSLRAVGYRQIWRHLAGETGLGEAVSEAVHASRQLAKRQLTWMRADPDARTFTVDNPTSASNVLKYIEAAVYGRAPITRGLV